MATAARYGARMPFRRRSLVAFVAALAGGAATAQDVDFARDVRPILSDKCFQCHGPDPETREALWLTSVESWEA